MNFHERLTSRSGNRSALSAPGVPGVKRSLLDRLADNHSALRRLCVWGAAASVVGVGAFGALNFSNMGGNGGGAAFGALPSLGSNKKEPSRLNKNGLPWPENPTNLSVSKKYSWDAEFANPGSASHLPDYGSTSVVSVNNTIDTVWSSMKSKVSHIKGEKVDALWKRLEKDLQPTLDQLGRKPTHAELIAYKNAAIATFIAQEMDYGAADSSIALLDPNTIVQVDYCTHPQTAKIANALLSQDKLRGVCVDIVVLTMALQAEAGIYSRRFSVNNRDIASDAVDLNNAYSSKNHSVVVVYMPTKNTKWIPLDKLERRVRFQEGLSAEQAKTFYDSTVRVVDDPTRWTNTQGSWDSFDKFPRPQSLLVGAKGDDIFRLMSAGRFATGVSLSNGESIFGVPGFGRGHNPSNPLPNDFQAIFDAALNFDPR